jgi:hypothetical protein
MEAGGFASDHGRIHFFTRVNALIAPRMTVVDFGAGRGAAFHSQDRYAAFCQSLAKLQGKVERVMASTLMMALRITRSLMKGVL